MQASDDPRVVASREALKAIPRWRVLKVWREMRKHVALVNRVIAEKHKLGE